MHPELLNNSLFLRYYEQWQKNPASVVFAAIADFFLRYNLVDDAQKICQEGLRHHPDLLLGHIVMAKVHCARGNKEEAEAELKGVLERAPMNKQAQDLLSEISGYKPISLPKNLVQEPPIQESLPHEEQQGERLVPSEWQTITMAKIYAKQGYLTEAKKIFGAILKREPENKDALKGLEDIT